MSALTAFGVPSPDELGAEVRNVVSRGNIVIKATEGFMQRSGGVFERNVASDTTTRSARTAVRSSHGRPGLRSAGA